MLLAALAPAAVFAAVPVANDGADQTRAQRPLEVVLDVSDDDFDQLTFAIDSGPDHGALGDCSAGFCTYTPATDYEGPDTFTWHASDGFDDSNIATFSIVVVQNSPPVANDQAAQLHPDEPLLVGLDAFDADDDDLAFLIDSGPSHGSLDDCSSGSCTYTPAAGYIGADSFTWHASDGFDDSSTATFSITVAVSLPLVATDQAAQTRIDQPLDISLNVTNDEFVDLTFVIDSGPSHDSLDDWTFVLAPTQPPRTSARRVHLGTSTMGPTTPTSPRSRSPSC